MPAMPRQHAAIGRIASWFALGLALALALPAPVGAELGDIVFKRKEAGSEEYPPATFPHYVHRMQFKCHVCHDALFEMRAGSNTVSMDSIAAGKHCGACHNGKIAFAPTFNACPRCHNP